MDSQTASTRNSVFISYSRADKRFLDELHAQLSHHVRMGLVTYWDDTKIMPGKRWKVELGNALQAAKVGVFLVSADFLASDFIANYELRPLLEAAKNEGVVILSVILSACVFHDTDLADFQAINAPSNPLNQMSRGKRDVIWTEVANFIKNALKD